MTERSTEPVTGSQYEIVAGPYRAVVTEAGAGLRELTCGGLPLVLSHDADEPAPAGLGQLLVPWPNRIDHGRYEYKGETYQLDISEPPFDCAIHGLTRWASWSPAEHERHRVRLVHRLLASAGYPFRLDLAVDYSLDPATGLTIRLTAANVGTRDAPYGHGAHPYITVGLPIDECEVTAPVSRYQVVDDRMIPSGAALPVDGTPYDLREPRVLGDRTIDNAFTGLAFGDDGRAWVHLTGGGRRTSFWMDDTHPWLQLYTADAAPNGLRRRGLGVEPMTCPPNAFASGLDLIDLKPGAQFTGSWGIIAG